MADEETGKPFDFSETEERDLMTAMTETGERMDLTPFRATLDTLQDRHSDACSKLMQYENDAHQMRLDLQRADEAVAYQRRRKEGIERRIVTTRNALRAIEDDASGVWG